MDVLPTDAGGQPRRWLIVFCRETKSRLVRWLVPGKYKHVRAIGFVAECDAYIFYDVWWSRTEIAIARGNSARAGLIEWTRNADVLAIDARATARRFQPILCCTTAVKHLIGLPGSTLRPDALYRDLLANGAVPVNAQQSAAAAGDSGDRSDS